MHFRLINLPPGLSECHNLYVNIQKRLKFKKTRNKTNTCKTQTASYYHLKVAFSYKLDLRKLSSLKKKFLKLVPAQPCLSCPEPAHMQFTL